MQKVIGCPITEEEKKIKSYVHLETLNYVDIYDDRLHEKYQFENVHMAKIDSNIYQIDQILGIGDDEV